MTINFLLGVLIGLLLNPTKTKVINIIQEYKKEHESKSETQFFESITYKEKFQKAKSIDNLLNN